MPDLANLKRKSIRGAFITLVSQGTLAGIQLVSVATLARLLSPEDYGLIGMVAAVTGFAGLFRDLGLSAAAIQKRSLTHAQQSNLFWLNLALGLVVTAVLTAIAPLVASFYHKPQLVWVTVVLSTTFAISSLSTQSNVLLVREMRFGRQALSSICGAAVTLLVAVGFACAGYRYWSLAWGQIAGCLTTTVLLLLFSPFWPGWLSRGSGVRNMLKFGANLTASYVANFLQRNVDNVLIGRFCGASPLGLYTRAYSLLLFPISNLKGPVNAVAFPAMSKLQNDAAVLRLYYLRATFLIALLSMPLVAFLFVSAEPVIKIVLGPKWLEVVPIFLALAPAAFIQPVTGFAGNLLLSLGKGQRLLRWNIANSIALIASFVIGLHWGPVGVALSYSVMNYVILYPSLSWGLRVTPVQFADFIQACSLPFVISALSLGLAMLLKKQVAASPAMAQIGLFGAIFLIVAVCVVGLTKNGRESVRFAVKLFPWRKPAKGSIL